MWSWRGGVGGGEVMRTRLSSGEVVGVDRRGGAARTLSTVAMPNGAGLDVTLW